MDDLVNRPPHYLQGKIEFLDVIEDQHFGFYDGQVLKYLWRYRHKGNASQDLRKAQFYIERLIKQVESLQ